MKRHYTCPKCQATLNPNVKIIMTAKKNKRRGLILFSPQPGNYNAYIPSDLNLKKGDLVQLFCPICGESLTSKLNKNLAEINFHLDNGNSGRVTFSRRYGEHASYFVTDETVRAYGDSSQRYGAMNFFGERLDDD